MVSRPAIGAALAAVVVFSSLLISNFALVAAAHEDEVLMSKSDAESYLSDNAYALEAMVGLTLLDELQALASSAPLACVNAASTVQARLETLSASQAAGPLRASGVLSSGSDGFRSDNMTSLRPFEGWHWGSLNLVYSVTAQGGFAAVGVRFGTHRVHLLSLPVGLGRLTAFCEDSVQSIESSMAGSWMTGCNSTRIDSLMNTVLSNQTESARAQGFDFGLTWSVAAAPSCQVSFTAVVSQTGIQGPEGPFTVTVEEAAVVLLPVGNATAPA